MLGRRPDARLALVFSAIASLALASLIASAQTPPNTSGTPWWRQPPGAGGSPPPAPATPPPPSSTPASGASPASPVIARVAGRPVTQAEFDRVGGSYLRRLRDELGAGFDADVRRQAHRTVLDELIRRELVMIEAERRKIEVTVADTDALLRADPFFVTNGRFDAAKFAAFKTDPGSNYPQILPRLRQAALLEKADAALRAGFTPSPEEVRAEWTRRNDQARLEVLTLLARDASVEPEADEKEWAAYYAAHPGEFLRRVRVRLRTLRLPLPPASDSGRAAREAARFGEARAVADSLRAGTLADSGARFTDSGLFEVPGAPIPGLGRVPGLSDTLARLETDSTIRVVGPYVARDAVLVGVVAERRPRELPPLRDVLPEVRRRADLEKRRAVADAERREFHARHADRWRTRRVAVTRLTLNTSRLAPERPAPAEIERWYARHGRSLFGQSDSARGWLPPLDDSLRAIAAGRLADARRDERAASVMARLAAALRGARDAGAVARAQGAVAETLAFLRGGPADSLFHPGFVDSLAAAGVTPRGTFLGPRTFGVFAALWRVDAVDTAFVPPYEAVRGRADQQFAEERRRRDEEEGRAHWERHRDAYRTPEKYALDFVAVAIAPPDSVRVPAAEIRARYDANLAGYRQEEQVRARHILFLAREAPPDVERAAKARADSLLAAIRAGAGDFAGLAKRFSQEPGAETSGGDLGWFGRGRMVREFEDAAFALKPGEVSGVVKTAFGYHIIRVEERRAAGTRPFEEVRDEIRVALAQARADSNARGAARALRRRLAQGGDAATLAAPHGGIASAPALAPNEALPGLGVPQGLAADLPNTAASAWAPGVYRAGNRYAVVRVRAVEPSRPAEFEEVRAKATEDARAAKVRAVFDQRVARLRDALAAGASADSAAAPWGGFRDAGVVRRSSGFLPSVGNEPRAVERAFALAPGQLSDTLHVAQGVVWLRVKERTSGDPAGYEAAASGIADELRRGRYDAWIAERRRAVRIEILRADLRAAAATR